ncbi:M13-type metalloendopeptidase [Streptomyces sp. NPDC058674]|uniref:M13-type metalloendopeptidase n=1 Tax=Streptomyces sp. NPDC058674 TaxID=3346592 RepID=UPI003668E111
MIHTAAAPAVPAAQAPDAPEALPDVILDPSVRPQDDFYRHVAGRWSDGFVLPEHRAEATMLSLLEEEVQEQVAAIIRNPGTDPAGARIADLFASFMDEHRIEERGPAALAEDLHAIAAAPDHRALAHLLGRLQAHGTGGAVEPSVATDPQRGDRYTLNLSPSGLGLPAASLYRGARSERLRERYAAHVAAMLSLAGMPDADTAATRVLRAETVLSGGHTPPDSTVTTPTTAPTAPATAPTAAGATHATTGPAAAGATHTTTVAELAGRDRGFPWSAWFAGLDPQHLVPATAPVRLHPAGFLPALELWWAHTPLDTLRTWLTWHHLHAMAPFGPRQVFAEHFSFYWRDLAGARRPWPRRLRATAFVQTVAGDLVGERYVRAHLHPDTLHAATRLVGRLADTYRTALHHADWMHEDTRAAALAKLDTMRFEIGHPAAAPAPHRGPAPDPGDLIGNVKHGRAHLLARQLARLATPVDRSEWRVLPQAVTAYYRHGLNQVVLPAGLLRHPVFTAGADPARDYAVLGSIVCHEMSHAFDTRGSRYDAHGRLREWWTAADRAEFTRRTALLVRQYDRYTPDGPDRTPVDGTRTAGENAADVNGLTIAQAAFAAELTARAVTGEEHGRQMRRFFVLWASMWRGKRTPERMRERLAHDTHAPPQFRCNGALGHVPAFYQAFDVHEGDGMYIRPTDRFTLTGRYDG